jgi:hypothetical protein
MDSPTFQSTTRFPNVAVPPVLLIIEGVIDCAEAIIVEKRIRKSGIRKNLERSDFMLSYSYTIAILQNYQQKQVLV